MADIEPTEPSPAEPDVHWSINYLREVVQDLRHDIRDVRQEARDFRGEVNARFERIEVQIDQVRGLVRWALGVTVTLFGMQSALIVALLKL